MRVCKTVFTVIILIMLFSLTIIVSCIPGKILMEEFANANEAGNKIKIAEKVLVSTDRTDMFTPQEARNIKVDYAELTKMGVQDALVTVDFGPKATVMAVYTPVNDGYEYVGEVGYFYDVDNIAFIRPDKSGLEVITFRERNNQSIGAMENGSFIRGYTYKEKDFKNVINIDENTEAWWNDVQSGAAEPHWHKITQQSNVKKSDDDRRIEAVKTQIYSTAENTGSMTRPDDSEFNEKNRRTVDENFYWNDGWQSFIIDEKTEKSTGEKVAVLKDFGTSPYVLTGDGFDKYRILREDGSIGIVNYDELSAI